MSQEICAIFNTESNDILFPDSHLICYEIFAMSMHKSLWTKPEKWSITALRKNFSGTVKTLSFSEHIVQHITFS